MNTATFEKIEKEMISGLRFPEGEVLTGEHDKQERAAELARALTLGNLEQTKIRIYFEDDTNCRVVETTVWGVTDKRVILKQGVVIPINRIHKIKI